MKNVEKCAKAVAEYVGLVLSAKQIVALTVTMFPGTVASSIMPSDYAGPNRHGNVYADQIFERTATGYKVLPANEIVRKPTNRTTQETNEQIIAQLKAQLAAKQNVIPTESDAPSASDAQETVSGETSETSETSETTEVDPEVLDAQTGHGEVSDEELEALTAPTE